MSTEAIQESAGVRGRAWDLACALVALVGMADAAYLPIEHLAGNSVRCMVVSGCDEVLQSRYATVAGGVPKAAARAAVGFAAFGHAAPLNRLTPFVAVMFLATLWFLYLQAFVIKSSCTYCLLSAAATT